MVEECPFHAPEYESNCSDYKDYLSCDYNYKHSDCGVGGLQCYPIETYTYSEDNIWHQAMFAPVPCVGEPEDLPIGEECNPKECPLLESDNQSDSSNHEGSSDCKYGYQYTDCGVADLQCSQTRMLTCSKDNNNSWQLQRFSILCHVSTTQLACLSKKTCDPNTKK